MKSTRESFFLDGYKYPPHRSFLSSSVLLDDSALLLEQPGASPFGF
jgi:hypothetical protein